MLRKKEIIISSEGEEYEIEWIYSEGFLFRYRYHRSGVMSHNFLSLVIFIPDDRSKFDYVDEACSLPVDCSLFSLYTPCLIKPDGYGSFVCAKRLLSRVRFYPTIYIYSRYSVGCTEGKDVSEVIERITHHGGIVGTLGRGIVGTLGPTG